MPRENRTTRRGGMRGDLSEVRKKGTSPSSSDSKKPSLWDSVKNWASSRFVPSKKSITQHSKAIGHARKYNQQQREHQVKHAEKVYEKSTQNSTLNKFRKAASDYVNKSFSFSSTPNTGDFQQVTYGRAVTDPNKPRNIVELAQNAATRDTAKNFSERRLGELDGYTIDQKKHEEIIHWGEEVLEDDTRINDWILDAPTYAECRRRLKIIQSYFDSEGKSGSALGNVSVWDPDANEYTEQAQIKLDAEYPPWLLATATKEDLDNWEYYKTYSHDVVQRVADSYEEAKREADNMKKYGYKSAFSSNPGDINSYSKAIISAIGSDDITIKDALIQYNMEYGINPLRHGKLKTVAGNAIFNMMDTLDFAARGARAIAASGDYLGGTHHSFEGQDAFWVNLEGKSIIDSMRAQKLFIDSGGLDLITSSSGGSYTDFDMEGEFGADIKAQLKRRFKEKGFEERGITWESVYDALKDQYYSRSVKKGYWDNVKRNLKKAYTDPDAEFSADTGSTVADILTETVLDPGLIIGGISKGATKGAVRSASSDAVKKGIRALVTNSDDAARIFKNPKVVRAFNEFVRSNEGRNIIFRKFDDFSNDADLLIRKLKRADEALMTTEGEERAFKNILVNDLMGANMDVNGNIISSTKWHRRALDNKAVKAMAYMDRAIDGIDSAIIKTSFAAPWLLAKGIQKGARPILGSRPVGRLVALKNLKNQEALRTVVDSNTGKVDITSLEKLSQKADEGIIDEVAAKKGLQAIVDEYDNLTGRIQVVTRDFINGKITDEDAMRAVSDEIMSITGNGKRTVDDLEAYINNITQVRYVGDVQNAFNDVRRSFDDLSTAINRRSSSAVDGFIDKVRQVKSEDDLRGLFRENVDNKYILEQRVRVIENLPEELKFIDDAYLNNLVEEVRTGFNANVRRDTEEFINETKEELKRIGDASSKTVDRNLSLDTFKTMLDDLNYNFKAAFDDKNASELEKRISGFVKEWNEKDYVIYNTGDALKVLDRMERQVQMRILMSPEFASEGSAVVTHRVTKEFRKLRKELKKIDVVSLKDAKVVTLMHTDRMALQQQFRNDSRIRAMYEEVYDSYFKSFIDEVHNMSSIDADFMESSFAQSMLAIEREVQGFTITDNMINKARTIEGMNDEQLHTFLNVLGSNIFFKDLDELVLNPYNLRRKLKTTLKTQTGESKLGMRNITDALNSVDTDKPAKFLEPYLEELQDPEIYKRYKDIITKDSVDPTAYVEKQMLATALMDSSVISTWNDMALAGKNPMGCHINTTGLNSDINSITSISFKKWNYLELSNKEPFSLKRLLDHLDEQETVVYRRSMTDKDVREISEDVLRSFDMKDVTIDGLRKHYKSFYGAAAKSGENVFASEQDLIEAVCKELNDIGQYTDNKGILHASAPSLIVHDLDGFNIPFFNKKVMQYNNMVGDDSSIYGYYHSIFKSAEENSFNTYNRLAEKTGDITFTEAQIDEITELLQNYARDINKYSPGYAFMNYRGYSDQLSSMLKTLWAKERSKEGLTDIESRFWKTYADNNLGVRLRSYNDALSDITKLTINPRQHAFISTGLEDNPVKTALRDSGRTSVNVESRIYVDDVLSFFDIDDNGFTVAIEDLQKMDDMAKYIIRKRNRDISSGALEFLAPRKSDFDRVIQAFKDMASADTFGGTQLSYIRNLKIPDNAVDSYLMADKLYKDFLQYWTDPDQTLQLVLDGTLLDSLKNQIENVKALDKKSPEKADLALLKDKLYRDAVDYMNNNRKRFFYERIVGDLNVDSLETNDIFEILEGAHHSEIYKSAARSDYHKQIYSYEEGVLKRGLDKATDWSEASSDVMRNLNDLNHIDGYFTARGLTGKKDRMLASLHMKAKQLFDIIHDTKIDERPSFQRFMNKASESYRLRLHNARLNNLKVDNKFDRTQLLSELLHNGFNMTVFNAHNYDVADMQVLREFVTDLKKNGDEFLSYYEDRVTGNIYIYINDNAYISQSGTRRTIHFNDTAESFERIQKDSIALPEFDELKSLDDFSEFTDIEDFRDIYTHLQSCWEDTITLSNGAINGTTGKALSRTQAEEFLATLPTAMNDWCTSEGLLYSEIGRGIVYDPGFAINQESDLLLDYLGTMEHQVAIAKDDAILANEMFFSNDVLKFSELADNFDDKELMDYFGNNPEYVVCSLSTGDTRTGFQVRQIKLNNPAALKFAKESPHTTILPYDVFCEVADQMNAVPTDDVAKRLFGKYLVAYKAFALVKPGTIIRNYKDATLKAALDTQEGLVSGTARMLFYEHKAIKGMDAYHRIMKCDPSLLTKSNWDIIQKTFKTDLSFDEFEILRGVMDGNSRFASGDRYFINKTAKARAGQDIISGKNIGLRNLEESDIRQAVDKYLSNEPDLPLSKKEFLDIYLGRVVPDEATNDLYEEMFRKLSINLRGADCSNIFDKTINNMFKPFGAVENIVRYAQTLSLVDQGYSGNQVLRHIHNTQFYTAPSWGVWNTLEKVMPFCTFKYNNIMYWIRMMDENPRYFRYFEEIYGHVMDDTFESMASQSQELDYEHDYALQSGGITIGQGKYYLNLGNSFMSAMNDFYGLPTDIDSINPLIKDTLRLSLYGLGLNSSKLFSETDIDITDDNYMQRLVDMVPGGRLMQQGYKTFHNIANTSTEEGGPIMNVLLPILQYTGVIGKRNIYKRDGKFSFDDWQEDLAAQGKWYDCNLGRVVDISQKNDYGANSDKNSFEDVQAYMMQHFGKIWDANQHKFVTLDKYIPGGWNEGFDWENNPEQAWEDLQRYQKIWGKTYDYNQRKFVYSEDFISGGLNATDLSFDQRVKLMQETFPNLKWDANQNTFVDDRHYIAGGLNDLQGLYGQEFLSHWSELKSLRYALYGEEYINGEFVKTKEPMIVLSGFHTDRKTQDKYDRYFSLLAIPRLKGAYDDYVIEDGMLKTSDGKYVLTGNPEHDAKVFDNVRHIFTYSGRGRGRRYSGWRNYSYNKTRKPKKPYVHSYNDYQSGYGWNQEEGYYRLEYSYSYQYHSPQPSSRTRRLINPPVHYPYGGPYGKFSFQSRV